MKQVRSLGHLIALAQDRRSVVSLTDGPLIKPKPAAFIIGWTGRMIFFAIQRGLYVYEKPKRKSK